MPYIHDNGTFGHSIAAVRAANPQASIPEGADFGDYRWYEPAPMPEHHPTGTVVESAPIDGRQVWRVVPASAQALAIWLRQALAAEYDGRIQVIAAGYPLSERESWPVQTEEARALEADPAAATPWIDAAALARGLDRLVLAKRIREKDDKYRQVHGLLTGTRQRIEDQIDAAADDALALSQIDVAAGWPAAPV